MAHSIDLPSTASAAPAALDDQARLLAAMREAGLMELKAPKVLGGDEAHWTLQTEVFE